MIKPARTSPSHLMSLLAAVGPVVEWPWAKSPGPWDATFVRWEKEGVLDTATQLCHIQDSPAPMVLMEWRGMDTFRDVLEARANGQEVWLSGWEPVHGNWEGFWRLCNVTGTAWKFDPESDPAPLLAEVFESWVEAPWSRQRLWPLNEWTERFWQRHTNQPLSPLNGPDGRRATGRWSVCEQDFAERYESRWGVEGLRALATGLHAWQHRGS
jgi:hypothetical protein